MILEDLDVCMPEGEDSLIFCYTQPKTIDQMAVDMAEFILSKLHIAFVSVGQPFLNEQGGLSLCMGEQDERQKITIVIRMAANGTRFTMQDLLRLHESTVTVSGIRIELLHALRNAGINLPSAQS